MGSLGLTGRHRQGSGGGFDFFFFFSDRNFSSAEMSATSGSKHDFPRCRELTVIAELPTTIFASGNFIRESRLMDPQCGLWLVAYDLKALMGTMGI